MDDRVQAAQNSDPKGHAPEPCDHPKACRRPPGRKPGPAPDAETFGRQLTGLIQHAFPEMNQWFDALPDPRRQELCVYLGRHLYWQAILTFLLRAGSRNAFDGDRNAGQIPENVLVLCAQKWDAERLGERRTVTCSGNVTHHLGRVPVEDLAELSLLMFRRLLKMRLLERARLSNRWWMIALDGSLQDRGRETPTQEARYRYIVQATLIGPDNTLFPIMTEFMDVRDPVREKEDCEQKAFLRLTERLHAQFPGLPICLLLDGLYAIAPVFERCEQYGWRFVATLREGRQPTAFDEAVQTMMMSPEHVLRMERTGEHGTVQQTLRWTNEVEFGNRKLNVLFAGEISPEAATLWAWVTNFHLTTDSAATVANQGGRARQGIETLFNVEKNGGFGLEHAFCANQTASKNYHLLMQVAFTLGQLLVNGCLRRLTRACRKVTDRKLVELLRLSLWAVRIDPTAPCFGQLRFSSS